MIISSQLLDAIQERYGSLVMNPSKRSQFDRLRFQDGKEVLLTMFSVNFDHLYTAVHGPATTPEENMAKIKSMIAKLADSSWFIKANKLFQQHQTN